jgi:hypothetical protein
MIPAESASTIFIPSAVLMPTEMAEWLIVP